MLIIPSKVYHSMTDAARRTKDCPLSQSEADRTFSYGPTNFRVTLGSIQRSGSHHINKVRLSMVGMGDMVGSTTGKQSLVVFGTFCPKSWCPSSVGVEVS